MTLVTSSLQDAPCNGINAGVPMGSIPIRFRHIARFADDFSLQDRYKDSSAGPADYELEAIINYGRSM